ncbi:MAG: aminopeptidase N [Rhodospirillales bacterium]|nr:aminopeptidase N [Rhodospirillales bacterium]
MSTEDNFTYLKDYKQPDYWVRHVDLTFDLQDGETFVTARLKVEKNGTHNRPLVLDGEKMELQSVEVDGVPMGKGNNLSEGYVVDDVSLSLQPADDEFILETRVRIEPEANKALEGLYKSSGNWCTQCEAEGFRRITYYVDRPDNMATFTTKIIADETEAPVLLSNGNMTDQGKTADGRHYTVWEDPFPKPSYLFALVGGTLDYIEDTFETKSGREVTLRIFADAKDLDKLDYAMDSLKRSMTWDEEKYGREYDLDLFNIVAVDDFNMGAMENKSLNIFNTKYVLANPETSTDADFAGVEGVIAHEYFHNWTGNRITCRDWYQLCLKEGLTVYRDQEFSADMNSRAACRISDVKVLRAAQFREDAGPEMHPPRPDRFQTINNFYTSTVYNKGAEVNRMLATLLGEEDFRKATDLYFDRFDGQAVTVEDWVQCMADASGRDMTQFMKWYTEAGTPTINASWDYDKSSKTFSLTLEQDVPKAGYKSDGAPRQMPVRFGLVGPDGKDVVNETLELTEQSQTFTFPNVPEGSVPSLFRHFSAPITLNAPYSDSDLLHLMAHDSDGFNQWEAGNKYMMNKMLEQIDRYEAGQSIVVGKDIVNAFATILQRTDMDPEMKSSALGLPGYNDLSQKRRVIDPQAITAVTDAFADELGKALIGEWARIYDENYNPGAAYDLRESGKRSLQNLALNYLTRGNREIGSYNSFWQYMGADNMTERYAGLVNMMRSKVSSAQMALTSFYEEHKDNGLVVDKWVAAQVFMADENAADVVHKLKQHESYKPDNPNRLRALYGSFMGNPKGFHAEDGSGYQLIADLIIELDQKNPQIAAGFLRAFAEYERYKPALRDLMEANLQYIAANLETPSKDVSEKLESYLGKRTVDLLRGGPSPS